MTTRPLPVLVVVAALVGCTGSLPPLPPAPSGVNRIAVEQPANRTGGDLVVDGPGLLQRVLRQETSTVPDLLAEDLRSVLTQQGFRVISGNPDDVPLLRTDIFRWQHYSADYSIVTVDLVASVVEPGSGRELWKAARSNWTVPTSAAGSRREASMAASSAIAEALLEGWLPAK